MKRIIALLIILLTTAFGCTADVAEDKGSDNIGGNQNMAECDSDSDCITGGCSNTICMPKDQEPIMTTCEYKEEYDCYNDIECRCIAGECGWDKDEEFEECITEKSGQGEAVESGQVMDQE